MARVRQRVKQKVVKKTTSFDKKKRKRCKECGKFK